MKMQEITYKIGDELSGSIFWSAAEQFVELRQHNFALNQMEATQIETLKDFSLTAKYYYQR